MAIHSAERPQERTATPGATSARRAVHQNLGRLARLALLGSCVSCIFCGSSLADDSGTKETGRPAIRTMGGKQFWADELFFHKWRIQRNVLTGHCRLLDGSDHRHASGTFSHCQSTLGEIRRTKNLPPMRGKAVVVLHGLSRSRSSMESLCRFIENRGSYSVFNVDYPSTRRNVAGHARTLSRILDNLDGIEEINFVAHSMGNIVVRHYLGDQIRHTKGKQIAPRIKRFVMLGPPNHGSRMASAFDGSRLAKTIVGRPLEELGDGWSTLEERLAIPSFPFGIIAGGKNDPSGFNPLLPGDDDGTVTIESARLAGASDFIVVPTLHSFLMEDSQVHRYTLRFLDRGFFISREERKPIPTP